MGYSVLYFHNNGINTCNQPITEMNKTKSNLLHFTGYQAYLIYWLVVYDCKVSISSLEAIDQNLEIIMNTEGDLLAYRYDHPIEIIGMVSGDGKWHLYNPEHILENERFELQSMILSLRMFKSFMN
jgi:hypothetical protein